MEDTMTQEKAKRFDQCMRREPVLVLAFTAFTALLLSLLFVHTSFAQEQGERTFRSAEEAGSALFAASQSENEKALLGILGRSGKEVISSGDSAEDLKERSAFVAKYEEMHRYVREANGTALLYVGAENWPFPIPLVNRNGVWYFDTNMGKEEILMRRIGRNELAAIDTCGELVDAEKQRSGNPPAAVSYSPTNVLMAMAGQKNAKSGDGESGDPVPFNGYFFLMLQSQKNVPSSAKSHIVNGKLVGGFAFVAYPAEYRSSGVMTFIVNQSGVVYEKDLGPSTVAIATKMADYNPDSSWHPVDEN
jgi:hypothetical protein